VVLKKLYFGDNLTILRDEIPDESVDLIYLDPPFNSKRDYNLLFKTPKGHESDAQITAFEDTWHWGPQARDEFRELMKCGNTDVAEMMEALRKFLGENDLMAYLTIMANRLLEMRRVLRPTGSLYLHCDPTASHYLKVVLDGVFGKENYRNEIIWKRTTTHSDSRTWSRVNDSIFFYTKGDTFTWNVPREPHSADYVSDKYRYDDGDGRGLYRLDNITSPNPRPNMMYEWKGFPFPDKGWRFERNTMEQMDLKGLIWYPRHKDGSLDTSKRPQVKRYLNEMDGGVMGTVWADISPINSQAVERLGYPTQKPLALLERIITASSNDGDLVLDPFCGCGTALDAAEKLKRSWIGIDITHLAVSLIEKRLKQRYPALRDKGSFEVHGVPHDFDSARDLAERDKHQFQLWACSLVGVQPYKGGKKGADQGVDGLGFIEVAKGKNEKVLVSVKGGENVNAAMIRDLKGTVEREKAAIGVFVTLTRPTKPMLTEAASSGHYESPHHGAFPRIQIVTIEGLLAGNERPKWPDLSAGGATFKKAKVQETSKSQNKLF
jgi:site-specific DNA-methyltransferase (adenine-specific)